MAVTFLVLQLGVLYMGHDEVMHDMIAMLSHQANLQSDIHESQKWLNIISKLKAANRVSGFLTWRMNHDNDDHRTELEKRNQAFRSVGNGLVNDRLTGEERALIQVGLDKTPKGEFSPASEVGDLEGHTLFDFVSERVKAVKVSALLEFPEVPSFLLPFTAQLEILSDRVEITYPSLQYPVVVFSEDWLCVQGGKLKSYNDRTFRQKYQELLKDEIYTSPDDDIVIKKGPRC